MSPAGGEMGGRIRAFDWAATPFGPPEGWPPALGVTLDLCLNSSFPMAIYWGPELRLIYNDAWAPIPGERHPAALGRPAHEVWPDIWPIVGPQFAEVIATGRGYATSDQPLPMKRHGRVEESYWDYSFTPITGPEGDVAGILNQGHEVTARVLEQRRHALMLAVSQEMRDAEDPDAIVRVALGALGTQLDLSRAGYAEVDLAGGTFRIVENWRRDPAVPDLAGVHPLGAFGADLHAAVATGAVFAVDDALADPRVCGRPIAHRYAAAGIRAGLVVPVLKHGAYTAAIFAQDDRPRSWTAHHEGLLATMAERIWQERARAQVGRALRESEMRHRLIFEQANDIVFTADLDQTITGANPAAGLALGVPAAGLVGRSIADFVSAEEFARTSGMLRRKLHGRGTTRYEVAVKAGGGRVLHWEINSTLATDDGGQPIGLHAIARDVSERHRHEQEQRRLIDELNHRVKNTLAVVQALAQQSFRDRRDGKAARAAFEARLAALAATHDILTEAHWSGACLGRIARATAARLAPAEGRILVEGPAVTLEPKAAVSLSLAFHELLTNAAEHGALGAPAGRLQIAWETDGDRLRLHWEEVGGPPAHPPERSGYGLRLVERALAVDLDGRVELSFPEEGFRCLIDAPLPRAPA